MRRPDPSANALPADPILPFRAIVFLLPLAGLLELALAWDLDLPLLAYASPATAFVQVALPPTARFDYNSWRLIFLAGAFLLIAVHRCPPRRRQSLLAVLAWGYLATVLGIEFLALYGAGVLTFWLALRRTQSRRWRLAAAAVPAVLPLLALLEVNSFYKHLGISLLVMTALKAYSAAADLDTSKEDPPLAACILALSGGFPCHFIGPFYSYSSFAKSFRPEPSWEMFRGGIARVYLGIAKLAAAGCYWLLLSPVMAGLHPTFNSARELWGYGFLNFLAFLMAFTGFFQLQIGMNRLFGHELEDTCHKPWMASSPLDLWRRLAGVSRAYMIKYLYYPIYRIWPNAYAPLFLICLLGALLNLVFSGPGVWSRSSTGLIPRIVYYWLIFSLACSLEIAVRRWFAGPASDASRPGPLRQVSVVAAFWVFMILVFAPESKSFDMYTIPPNLLPGRTLWERHLTLYGRMMGW